MKKGLLAITLLLILGSVGFVCIQYYSYVFAKTVKGEVIRVERVNNTEAIITGKAVPASQLFSFAVAIKDSKGEIHTASSEDRQWAVVNSGQCAEAKFFPYPPWLLDKANTYYGARLERLFDCKNVPGGQKPETVPSPSL